MASNGEMMARANALLMAPNPDEFRFGVLMLRNALAGNVAMFDKEVRDCAIGLLGATDDPRTQAGIAALARTLGVELDLYAQRCPVVAIETPPYWQLPTPGVLVIDAHGREVVR